MGVVKKAIKQLRNNKAPLDIETELLKKSLPYPQMQQYFIKEVWSQKHIINKWSLSHINAL